MGTVISLDDRRPHITITTQGNAVHVIPVAFFEDVARGKLTVDALDCRDEIMRLIIAEWLDLIGVDGAWRLRQMDDDNDPR